MVTAVLGYAGFLAVIGWSMAFFADLQWPTGIDSRTPGGVLAAVVDLLLLAAFAVHHSVMARPAAKRLLCHVVPVAAERSVYVLVADLLLGLVLWQWRPVGGTLWQLRGEAGRDSVWILYGAGWATAIAATFMIDHLDLVGLRQAFGRGRPAVFRARRLYNVVRHPLMLGLIVVFSATPTMTVGHLLFAAIGTGYILLGIRFEERDLRRELGPVYEQYARRTPALIPVGALRSRSGRRPR